MLKTSVLLLSSLLLATPALAADQTSSSYTLRAANTNSGSARALTSTAPIPRFSSSSMSLGQSSTIGFASASGDLETVVPGFWAIVVGLFPTLDTDGDLLAAFEDPDDDNDGLLDSIESNTGVFVSGTDTGSNPQSFDTDGDGAPDGFEVAVGTDPNDPSSLPKLPALAWFGQLALVGLIAIAGAWKLMPTLRRPARKG